MSPSRFLLATILGVVPSYALVAYLLYALARRGGTASPLPPWLLLAVLCASLFAAVTIGLARPGSRLRFLAFAVFAFFPPLLILVALQTSLTVGGGRPSSAGHRYGAVIDAGSSGSRIALFEWRMAGDGTPHVWPVAAVESDDSVQCRLARIATDESAVCGCLRGLTARGREEAKAFLGEPTLPRMPLWVKATAGVRSSSTAEQGKILGAANACLATSGDYEWRGAEVIPGEMEALYAWLAVNHLAGTLRTPAIGSTLGIVELGGRSAQIAYRVPAGSAPSEARGKVLEVALAAGPLRVFAMSDLIGKQAAVESLGDQASGACALDGDPSACVERIDQFLCPSSPASRSGARCPARRPPVLIPAGMQFTGLSNFAHAARNMGLGRESLEEVRKRAMEICGAPKSDLIRKYVMEPAGKYRSGVCLDALYTAQLAGWGWEVPLERIRPPDQGRAGDPSWPLGAMIYMLVDAAANGRAGP